MHASIILLTFLFSAQILLAQLQPDSIRVIDMSQDQYKYKDATLELKQLLHVTEQNPEAYAAIRKAIQQRNGAKIMGFTGGGMIGYSFGVSLGSGGEPMWWLAGVGVGFIGVSALISNGSKKNALRGVALHNAGLSDLKTQHSGPVRLGMSCNGLGVSWLF